MTASSASAVWTSSHDDFSRPERWLRGNALGLDVAGSAPSTGRSVGVALHIPDGGSASVVWALARACHAFREHTPLGRLFV